MARLPRLAVAELPHLVRLAAHGGQVAFHDDQDRRHFLAALRESALQHRAAVHAYVLLDDEVRLLLTPPLAAALGLTVQSLGRRYVAGFNRRHRRSGTLWAGRFRAAVVQPGAMARVAMLAIETLPVRLGLVPAAGEFAWSSVNHHLGTARDPVVTVGQPYWDLGNTPFEREAAYRRLTDEGLSGAEWQRVEAAARTGWALGDATFLRELAQTAGQPVTPRARGRPRQPAD